MDAIVRKLILEPLISGDFRLIVPDFTIESSDGSITTPSLVTRTDEDDFEFAMHFMQADIPTALRFSGNQVLTVDDRLRIRGQLEGEISFSAMVFPPMGRTSRSRGTSKTSVSANRLELEVENLDLQSVEEIRRLLGEVPEPNGNPGFSAHVIFHGPELHLLDCSSEIISSNDFLGQSTSSSFDTHRFSGNGWQGALIQSGREIHLHLRDREGASQITDPTDLVDRICDAVAFVHGFQPWPLYREIRIDHRVTERWISPRLNLKQTFMAPVSKSLGNSLRFGSSSVLAGIIPTISEGYLSMNSENRDRLSTLLWNVRSSALGDLPTSTKLLVVCSAIDGILRLIAGDIQNTTELWRTANDRLGFSWDRWMSHIFEVRGRHRHGLSHGRLWLPEESPVDCHFSDYPLLGCAFMILYAAFCGYEGRIVAHPPEGQVITISNIRSQAVVADPAAS